MAASTQTEKTRFSVKSFGIGLGLAALVYVVLFVIAFSQQEDSLRALQDRLASMTVLVDNKGQLTFTITQQNPEHTETVERVETTEPEHTTKIETPPDPEDNLNLEDIVSQQSKALREAPVEGFYEVSAVGKLPIAKSPTQTPFLIYSKPFVLNKDKPYISVVINDFGLSESLSRDMIETLPSNVTFILSPYSQNPEDWIKRAREDGHEVWIGLPVENENFPLSDPGAKALLTRVSLQYNQDRLEWVLGRTVGYTGVAAFTDGALEEARNVFEKMIRGMLGRGIGYFEINTQDDSFILPLAKDMRVPHAHNSATIEVLDETNAGVKQIYARINRNGHAVALIEPSPVNLKALSGWLVSLEEDGIASVPLSAVAAPDTERN